MIGLLIPGAVAVLVGLAQGGSLSRCLSARIAWWPVVLAAFAVELGLYNQPLNHVDWSITVGPSIWVIAKLAMLVVVGRNAVVASHGRPAWMVIFAGMALNTLAIAANGGHMPQSTSAAAAVWGADFVRPDAYAGRLENVSWMGPDSHLAWLCDILPLPRWLPRPNVLSIGDLILAVGVGAWILGGMRRTPEPHGQPLRIAS